MKSSEVDGVTTQPLLEVTAHTSCRAICIARNTRSTRRHPTQHRGRRKTTRRRAFVQEDTHMQPVKTGNTRLPDTLAAYRVRFAAVPNARHVGGVQLRRAGAALLQIRRHFRLLLWPSLNTSLSTLRYPTFPESSGSRLRVRARSTATAPRCLSQLSTDSPVIR